MLYGLEQGGPRWETLIPENGDRPPVEVLFPAVPGPKALRKAREAARAAQIAGREAGDSHLDILFDSGDAFSRELIRWSILDWRGLGFSEEPTPPTQDREVRDADGNLVETVPGSITAFLNEPRLFEAADAKFVIPWTNRDAEKNGYAPSSDGTSARATQEADTAMKLATSSETDDATSAPTSSTNRKPKREKRSGS